jgi:hypothetical protein
VLTGYEFWRGTRKLSSGWLLIMIIGIHAALYLSRVFWPGWILLALTGSQPVTSVFVLSGFELLFIRSTRPSYSPSSSRSGGNSFTGKRPSSIR